MVRKTEKFVQGLIILAAIGGHQISTDTPASEVYRHLEAQNYEWDGERWAQFIARKNLPVLDEKIVIRVNGKLSDVKKVVDWLSQIVRADGFIGSVSVSRLVDDTDHSGRQYIDITPLDLPF